ncbi:toxin [Plantibacter sp. Mn2098]|uniref:toxin n=1 Tax=Plantibacter sp. Mn2098 TaxID=3395266 RepID=UPI003BC02428
MDVHDSARKHGTHPDDAIRAATSCLLRVDLDDDSPARQLRLGFDRCGRFLEVVVLTFDDGTELVIHAMPARKRYLALLP